MKELHVLLDYENVQPSLEVLAKLAPGFTDVWLFHGPHQAKQAQAYAAGQERVTLVPRSGQGPNALDFHVAFYLGYVAAKHPDAELVVVRTGITAHLDALEAAGQALRWARDLCPPRTPEPAAFATLWISGSVPVRKCQPSSGPTRL